MKNIRTTKLEGLQVRRKLTGEIFTITGKDECGFFLLNGGADNGGRDVMPSELHYYERVGGNTPCAQCSDTGFIKQPFNVWMKVLNDNPRLAYAHRGLNQSYRPCACGTASKLHLDHLPTSRDVASLGGVA